MISIGVVLRGPEITSSAIAEVLRRTARAVLKARGGFRFGDTPAINVVFHVAGSQGRPDWEGLREAKFSTRQKLLMIQVAVPDEFIRDSASAMEFVFDSLRGANAIAFEHFRKRNLSYALQEAEALVSEVRKRILDQ